MHVAAGFCFLQQRVDKEKLAEEKCNSDRYEVQERITG